MSVNSIPGLFSAILALLIHSSASRIHGGSFILGSATGPGLDGAALSEATGSIVAVIQYRLGAFGFLLPQGTPNLAVNDVIKALQFLQKVLPSFNGDVKEVTIAGQSSGATLVRALLATPSASSLFKSASLHSDPMVSCSLKKTFL
jgi:carboxylesterase type B